MRKAVFTVFLSIVGLSAISAQAFSVSDGNGDFDVQEDNLSIRQAVTASINHINSPYFVMPEVFELKSNENLTILSHYPTFQQTTEYSCGPAAALTVLEYYGKKGVSEEELIEKMGASFETGTSVKGIANYFRHLGWNVQTNLDAWQPLEDYEPFAAFVQEQLKLGHPIMVENVFKGGHWRVIIGYDTMGTQESADDVLIFADSYDTADHNQDGYGIENGENFFWSWFDHQILPEDERTQPFVLAYPKERRTE
ncbi:MAG: C39 family peptidase [Alphaproteobacteria bacterium]|nr:C39 family peptidase [Alphaproteobacteria bacterium]